MKEVTTIITLEVTSVEKCSDEKADNLIEIDKKDTFKKYLAEQIKHDMNVDNVVITNVQDFVMDVE